MRIAAAFAWILFGIVSGLLDVSVFGFLSSPWKEFSVVLPIAVTLAVHAHPRVALLYAVSAGLAIDLFALQHPSFAFIRLAGIALLVMLAARTALTNHSLIAVLVLLAGATLTDALLRGVVGAGFSFSSLLIRALWGCSLLTVLFLLQLRLSRRFYLFRNPSRL